MCYSPLVSKMPEVAFAKAAELLYAAQEQIGRDPLQRIDALALLTKVENGIRELDAEQGEPLDIEPVIRQAHEGC